MHSYSAFRNPMTEMTKLNDEQRPALDILARHLDGG
jgi:hypothetical protein